MNSNLIHIRFHRDSIPLRKTGYDGHLPEQFSGPEWTFSHRGVDYAWTYQPAEPDSTNETRDFPARHFPRLVHHLVIHILQQELPAYITVEDNQIWFRDGKHIAELAWEIPRHPFSPFSLTVRPPAATLAAAGHDTMIRVRSRLQSVTFDNAAGTRMTFVPDTEYREFTVQEPRLHFRPESIVNHQRKDIGLPKYGPYSATRLQDQTFRTLVIVPERQKMQAQRLLGTFRNGLPHVRRGSAQPFPQGWAKTCGFTGWTTDYVFLSDADSEEVVVNKVAAQPRPEPFNLAFVFDENRVHLLHTLLLERGIPVEIMVLPRDQKNEYEQALQLRDLAVRAYAKCGGIPWLLPQEDFDGRIVVIGVGSTVHDDQVYGYCTLFTQDGRFRLGKSSVSTTIGEWQNQLSEFVDAQLHTLAQQDKWNRTDQIKLIFHFSDTVDPGLIPPLKDHLRKSYQFRHDCSFTFLLMGYHHRDHFWDLSRTGRKPLVPRRGTGQEHDAYALIQLRELADAQHGQVPFKIWLHPDSDEKDLRALAHRVFRFSNIAWTTAHFDTLPATLLYGNLLTERLYALDQAGYRDRIAAALKDHPDLKTWFL